jgi:ATP-dependent DNA helicase RecQ
MATIYPCNLSELANVSGISKGKAEKYGLKFADAIKQYVEDNDIERISDFNTLKQMANKSVHKIHIIQNIDKKLPLDEIARMRGMKITELIDEIETIVTSGTKLNLDYYLNDIIEDDLQEDVMDYFREMESGDLNEAFTELKEEGLSYEEVRLMHIKFMSEVAN